MHGAALPAVGAEAEAYRRIQTARMRDRLPDWAAAARTGTVGVAQSEAMGRVAANPRIEPAVLARDAGMPFDDAIDLSFVEFERNLRTSHEVRTTPAPRRRREPAHGNELT